MCCMVKMVFAVKMVNNKVVENFSMYLVLKFQSNRPKSLGVMAVQISVSELLALWNFWTALSCLSVLVKINCELAFSD